MNHPRENDLALLAGGEAGRIRRFLLDRHVRTCADCRQTIAEYREMRSEMAAIELPDVNWNFRAADMRANIRLGLEAGACVRAPHVLRRWNPRVGVALASLALVVVSSFFLRELQSVRPRSGAAAYEAAPVLLLTKSGVEISSGENSLTLLNHNGNATNQTVNAQGHIGTRDIDSETGSVTIKNVYLQ